MQQFELAPDQMLIGRTAASLSPTVFWLRRFLPTGTIFAWPSITGFRSRSWLNLLRLLSAARQSLVRRQREKVDEPTGNGSNACEFTCSPRGIRFVGEPQAPSRSAPSPSVPT